MQSCVLSGADTIRLSKPSNEGTAVGGRGGLVAALGSIGAFALIPVMKNTRRSRK